MKFGRPAYPLGSPNATAAWLSNRPDPFELEQNFAKA
jgi:hypothetical protein